MKRSTLKLLAVAGLVYIGFLIFIRGFLSPEFTAPIPFLVIPLVLLVLILINDLASRAMVPSKIPAPKPSGKFLGREVESLTRQVEVAFRASPDYFETVLLNRLRESLVEKVSLETGMAKDRVREVLVDGRLGPNLLGDQLLHRLLYSTPLPNGQTRLKMLRETIALIEAWKA